MAKTFKLLNEKKGQIPVGGKMDIIKKEIIQVWGNGQGIAS